MSAEGKKKDKGFITLLVLIIVCACLMIAAVTTLGIGMSNGVTEPDDNPGQDVPITGGTVWSSGTGAPAADAGNEGDFYLDTSSGNIYQKSASGWSVVMTIPLASEVTPSIGEDGYWYIGSKRTDVKAAGTDGLVPSIGADGYWYIGDKKTDKRAWHEFKIENNHWIVDGEDLGAALVTPHIGNPDNGEEEGYWYIGDTFTGIKAEGSQIEIRDGGLYVDGVRVPLDTLKGADGNTPYIGKNGNWWIGEKDLQVPAEGKDGQNGVTPHIDEETGHWFIGDEDTEIPATGADGKNGTYWHSGEGAPVAEETTAPDTFYVANAAEGDFYFDTATGDVYRLENGAWALLTSLTFKLTGNQWTINGKATGLSVAQWYNGNGDPNGKFPGYVGDYYLDVVSGTIYKNVSTQLDGELKGTTWEKELTIRSNQWFSGKGSPLVNLNGTYIAVGDMYLDIESGQVWHYTADGWAEIEGLILKGKDGTRGTRLFSGNAAPTDTNPDPKEVESGDLYFDTSKGIIYTATKDYTDGSVKWDPMNADDPLAGTKWLSGAKDPADYKSTDEDNTLYNALQEALENDVYFNTTSKTLWQKVGGEWQYLGSLAEQRANKWYHGSYDPSKYVNLTDEKIKQMSEAERADYNAFKALTSDVIEGDFYLQAFSAFSGYTGMRIYVYQHGMWALLADARIPVKEDEIDGYNIPTLDVLTEFRNVTNGTTTEGSYSSDKWVKLSGIITMPEDDFTSVGTSTKPFTGKFDGQRKSGYYIENLGDSLFGTLGNGAEIKDLYLKGKLNNGVLATFFTAEQNPDFGSLLTGNYGLAKEIQKDAKVTLSNVTLELTNEVATVTVDWDEKGEVTVTVKSNDKANKLTIGGTGWGYNSLLELGKGAKFVFEDVDFAGETYLDVTNAKSLTLRGVTATVDPIEAAERDTDGTIKEWVDGGYSGQVAKNRSAHAAFIVSQNAENASPVSIRIEGTKIYAAQSTENSDSALNTGLHVPDVNSMAIYISTQVAQVVISDSTFGSEKASERYSRAAIMLTNIADNATLNFDGNTVYGTNNHGQKGRGANVEEFNAFVLGKSEDAYSAYFVDNTVDVSMQQGGAAANFLAVEGTGHAQVYLLGSGNKFNKNNSLYKLVKAEAENIDFIVFSATVDQSITSIEDIEDPKLSSGLAYLGKDFGEEGAFGKLQAATVENGENNHAVWVIDTHYADPVGFIKHVADENTYYINNAAGFGYFRDSVNGTKEEGTVTGAKDYAGEIVNLGKYAYTAHEYDMSAWTTSIGSYEDNTAFKGTFDGNGSTLENLNVALFGNLGEGAKVQNLNIVGATISGEKNVGTVASVATGNVAISNVAVTGAHLTLKMPTLAEGQTTLTADQIKFARSIGGIIGAASGTVTLGGVTFGKVEDAVAAIAESTPAGQTYGLDCTITNKYTEGDLNYLVYNYGLVGSTLTGETEDTTWAAGKKVLPAADMDIVVGKDEYNTPTSTVSFSAYIEATKLALTATLGIKNAASEKYVLVTAYDEVGLNNIAELVEHGVTFAGANVMIGADINLAIIDKTTQKSAWNGIGTADKAFEGTFMGAPDASTEKNATAPVIHTIYNLTGALFNNLNGTVKNLNISEQCLNGEASIATKAEGAKINNVIIDAWAQSVDGVSSPSVSALAAAPFGIYGEATTPATVTNSTISVAFKAQNITFTAAIDDKQNAEVTFEGDTLAADETAATHTYKAVINNQIFRLGGFNLDNQATTPTVAFTFTGIKFTGNSYIQLCASTNAGNRPNVTELTVTNCYADVTPGRAVGLNGDGSQSYERQPAFIVGYERWNAKNSTKLVVENNVILSETSPTTDTTYQNAGLAIFSWSPFADGTVISGNTFGSADRPFHNAVIKVLDFQSDLKDKVAKITIEGNTFFADAAHLTEKAAAIDLAPSQNVPYEVWVKNNTLNVLPVGEVTNNYTLVSLERAGSNARRTRVFIIGNTVNVDGEAVKIDYSFVTKGDGVTYGAFDFVGYNVVLDEATGKIKSGDFIFGYAQYDKLPETDATNAKAAAEALSAYVAEGHEADIRIVIADGLGRRLSDMLTKTVVVDGKTQEVPGDFNTYYIFNDTGLKNFISLVNSGTYNFENKTVKFADELNADHTLDLSSYNTSETNAWTPIGKDAVGEEAAHPFKGTFDGSFGSGTSAGNWTITGLKYTDYAGTETLLGFFGYTEGGEIKNLDIQSFDFSVKDKTASGTRYIGFLVAHAKGTTISNINVSAKSKITAADAVSNATGAVVGLLEGGKIENVSVDDTTIDAEGVPNVGAVVGLAKSDAEITKVYVGGSMKTDENKKEVFVADTNTSVIVTGSAKVGGVIGYAESEAAAEKGVSVNAVYSAAKVTAKGITATNQYPIGGIIGAVKAEGKYTVANAHFVGTLTRLGSSGYTPTTKYENYGLVGTESEAKVNGLTITSSDLNVVHHDGFVQSTVWDKDGEVTSEYQITSEDGLNFFRDQVNGGNSYKDETIHVTQDIALTSTNFAPIGSTEHPFEGTFTGFKSETEGKIESYTISSLKVMHHATHDENDGCSTNSNYAGLFGVINDATIENINFSDVTVEGREYVGILAGEAKGTTTIENVNVTTATVNGHHWVGGLVGYATGTLAVENNTVTGLTANAVPEKTVDESSNVRFDNGDKLGGLVGYLNATKAELTKNTVEGATLTAYRDLGGLVGIDDGKTTKGTYKENTVKNTTITVKKTGYTSGTFCVYKSDYNYLESDKGATQNAEWLVGRGNENANNNVTPNEKNERINVTIKYAEPEGANGFIFDNGEWRILSAEGLKTFAELSKKTSTGGEKLKHSTWEYTAGFKDEVVVIDNNLNLSDLNVSATADPETTPAPVLPIENFAGTFDGHGHTISNMTVTATGDAGFFKELKGSVLNVTFENANVISTGNNGNAGVIAGKISAKSTISNVTVNGATVTASAESGTAAALATFADDAEVTVTEFHFYGTLTGSKRVLMSGEKENEKVHFTNSTVALVMEGTDPSKGFYYGAYVGEDVKSGETVTNATVYGDGEKAAYFIESAEGLGEFGKFLANNPLANETVYLLNNVEVDSWTTSNSFNGTFEGMGHTITVKNESKTAGYLFNNLGVLADAATNVTAAQATINNLTLSGISVAQNFTNVSLNSVHVSIKFSGEGKVYYGLAGAAAKDASVEITSSDINVDCDDYTAAFSWDDKGAATAAADYTVKTVAGLSYLATVVNSGIDFSGKTVTLNGDINLKSDEWTPIGTKETPFKGTFDGNSKTISNLTISANGTYVGLFGYVESGVIKELTINGVSISLNSNFVGVLAGYLNGTTLNNITINGTDTMNTVFNTGDNVGGVAGKVENITVSGKLTLDNLNINGNNHVGGLFGQFISTEKDVECMIDATLTNMLVECDQNANSGAVIGYVEGAFTLKVNFSGALNLPEDVLSNDYHGMFGTVKNSAVAIADESTFSVQEHDGYVVTYEWNANKVTTSVAISSEDGLKYFRSQILAGNDYAGVTVTLEGGKTYDLGKIDPLYDTDKKVEMPFSGTFTFESEDETVTQPVIIASMTVATEDAGVTPTAPKYKVGFFSKLEGAIVSNITFTMTIEAKVSTGIGAVASYAKNSTIENVTVNATITGGVWVGGIVGYADGATIKNNTVTGTLSTYEYKLGALVGYMTGNTEVTGNTVGAEKAPVELTLAKDGSMVGGLVGGANGGTISKNVLYVKINAVSALENYEQYTGALLANGTPATTLSENEGEAEITVKEGVTPINLGLTGANKSENKYTLSGNKVTVEWKMQGTLHINKDGYYTIGNAEDLSLLRDLVNAGYTFEGETIVLTDDIELVAQSTTPIGGTSWTTTKEGAQVCNNPFMGEFNGAGHTISGLIVKANSDSVFGGLFGYIDGSALNGKASVHDLTLNNITVYGFAVVGAVAGAIENGIIKNVTVQGDIELVSTYAAEGIGSVAGGIAGILYASSEVNCTVKHSSTAKAAARATARLAANSEAQKTDTLENNTHIIAALQYAGGVAGKLDLSKVDKNNVSLTFDELHVSGMVIQILASDIKKERAAGGLVGSGNVTVEEGTKLEVEVHDNDVRRTEIVYPELAEGETQTNVNVGAFFGEKSDNVTTNNNAVEDVYKYENGTTEKVELKDGLVIEPVAEGKSLLGAYMYNDGNKVTDADGKAKAQWYEVPDEQALSDLYLYLSYTESNPSADVYLTAETYDMTGKYTGSISKYSGHFYGNGATIKGWKNSFFTKLNGGAYVEDLTIYTTSAFVDGVVIGSLGNSEYKNETVVLDNINVYGDITGGYACVVNSATSYAMKDTEEEWGKIELLIKNCENHANLTAGGVRAVGFVGTIYGISTQLENCKNYGDLTTTTSSEAHGAAFVGYSMRNTAYDNKPYDTQYPTEKANAGNFIVKIIKCENYGSITCTSTGTKSNGDPADGRANVGGIISTLQGGKAYYIENCKNAGAITGIDDSTGAQACVGGLVGRQNGYSLTISECTNTGSVTAKATYVGTEEKPGAGNAYAGGIVGNKDGSAVLNITGCVVEATITASSVNKLGCAGAFVGNGSSGTAISDSRADITLSATTAAHVENHYMFGGSAKLADNVTISDSSIDVPLAEGFKYRGEWSESGVYSGTYTITSEEGFEAFRNSVNAGNTYEGETVVLDVDSLDFSASNWTPVGTKDHPFGGSFIGRETTLTTITYKYDNATAQLKYGGLFGYICGTDDPENPQVIKNLILNATITDTVVGSDNRMGGVAGNAYGQIKIENVTVNGTIESYTIASGFIADAKTDGGELDGSRENTDTITFINCKNYADINAPKGTGFVSNTNGYHIFFDKCENHGDISVTNAVQNIVMGGFLGYIQGATVLTYRDCTNYGNISIKILKVDASKFSVGGISGGGKSTNHYYNVINYGNIEVTDEFGGATLAEIGGLVGSASGDYDIHHAENHGNISVTTSTNRQYSVGGFFGQGNGGITIESYEGQHNVMDATLSITATETAPEKEERWVGAITGNAANAATKIENTDINAVLSSISGLNKGLAGEGSEFIHTGEKYKYIKNVTYTVAKEDSKGSSVSRYAWDNEGNLIEKVTVIYDLDGLKDFRDQVNGTGAYEGKANNFSGATVVLASDIDLKGEVWTPIGDTKEKAFAGTFDGMGHTIKNLKLVASNHVGEHLKDEDRNAIGLFGYLGHGYISNLVIENVRIEGPEDVSTYNYAGALVGYAFAADGGDAGHKDITNVTIKGLIEFDSPKGSLFHVGVVIGHSFSYNYIDVHVQAVNDSYVYNRYNMVGGIVGFGENTNHFTNVSVSNIDINGSNQVGGIIGIGSYGASMENVWVVSVNITARSDPSKAGAFIGSVQYNDYTLNNVHFAGNVNGGYDTNWKMVGAQNDGIGSLKITNSETVFGNGFETTVVWDSEGSATLKDVKIYNRDGLIWFANAVNGGYAFENITVTLASNIDLGGMYWSPIGSSDHPFKGTFNGGDHTISNLTVNSDTDNAGLFGSIDNAQIINLKLYAPTVTGKNNVGALVGHVNGSENGGTKVYNITVTNPTITGIESVGGVVGGFFPSAPVEEILVEGLIRISGNYKVGGVVGAGYGTIKTATVNGEAGSYIQATYLSSERNLEGDNVGGIIGYTGEGGYSYTNLHVSGVTVSGTRKVGGIMGYMNYGGVSLSEVSLTNVRVVCNASDEYAKANENGLSVGGVVGEATGSSKSEGVSSITVDGSKLVNVRVEPKILYESYTELTLLDQQGSTKQAPSQVLGRVRKDATNNVTITINGTLDGVAVLYNGARYVGARHYVAYTAEDLLAFNAAVRSGKITGGEGVAPTLEIKADIDMAGKEWVALHIAHGVVDGGGHTISNLDVTPNGGKAAFLAGYGNTISNLTIKNFTATGEQVAVFIANPQGGLKLSNCKVAGEVNLTYTDIATTNETYNAVGIFTAVTQGFDLTTSIEESLSIAEDAKITINVTGMTTDNYGPTTDYLFGYYVGAVDVEGSHLTEALTAEKVSYVKKSITILNTGVKYSGSKLELGANADIEEALELLESGDTIVLEEGATYEFPSSLPVGGEIKIEAKGATLDVREQERENRPDDGVYLVPNTTLTIEGGTINLTHTAFNYFNSTEGILSGNIIFRNVNFVGHLDEKGVGVGYALVLGFDSTAKVTFEGCSFTKMYCAVYINTNTTGNATVNINGCTFTNTKWGVGLSTPANKDEGGTVHVTFTGTNSGLTEDNKFEKLPSAQG